jgi:hypothetical protein
MPEWTKEYPIKDGEYWFYGSAFSLNGPPCLSIVSCRILAPFFIQMLVCGGITMYVSMSKGVFMPADVPELPTEEEMPL